MQTFSLKPLCQPGHTVGNKNKWNRFQYTMRHFPLSRYLFFPANSCCSEDEDKYPICIPVLRKNAIPSVVQERMRGDSRSKDSKLRRGVVDSDFKTPVQVCLEKQIALTEPRERRLHPHHATGHSWGYLKPNPEESSHLCGDGKSR